MVPVTVRLQGEEKKHLPGAEPRFLAHLSHCLVAVPTELSRLQISVQADSLQQNKAFLVVQFFKHRLRRRQEE
jgi:hypothetical protein